MITSRNPFELTSAVPDGVADFRLQVQRAEQERTALRDNELAAQVSPAKDPRERIEIWERLHALRLPRASGHQLLTVIARQTDLTIGQVRDEQIRRAAVGRAEPR
jgi:hypothetical protein